jgi:hypothetical protein
MSESTQTSPAKPDQPLAPITPKTARFPLPTGVVTPIELRNHLVKENIAAATLKPQQMYAYVKAPGKTDPFPVKWYDEAGNVYDKAQADVLTRPGIDGMQNGVDWYIRRNTPKTAEEVQAAVAADTDPDESTADDTAGTDNEDGEEGDFDEAE